MSSQPGHPIVGHHAGWGLSSSAGRPQPYKVTPGASDTMCVRVREKIDILGVGTDVVSMEGTFTVRRDHACAVSGSEPKWGESCIKTEFRSLELYGESPVFGTVRVHLDPSHSSHGEVGPAEAGSLAASCVAHCFPTIELPDLGLKLTTGGQAIDLASKVVQVPPVGDVARSENSAPLVDEFNRRVGEIISSDIEVGELICTVPLGSTGPKDAAGHDHGTHSHHTPHSHPDPSGPCFYAQPPATTTTPSHPHGPGEEHTHEHPTHEHPAPSTSNVESVLARLEAEIKALAEVVRQLAGR